MPRHDGGESGKSARAEYRRLDVARTEPHARAPPPAPRLDFRLDPPSERDDPRHSDADELPARRGHGRFPVAAGTRNRYPAIRAIQVDAVAAVQWQRKRIEAHDDGRGRVDRL